MPSSRYSSAPGVTTSVSAESNYSESGTGTYSGKTLGMGFITGLSGNSDFTVDTKLDSSSTYSGNGESQYDEVNDSVFGTHSTSHTEGTSTDVGSTTFSQTFHSLDHWDAGGETYSSTDTTTSQTTGKVTADSSENSTSAGTTISGAVETTFDNSSESAGTKAGKYSSDSKITIEVLDWTTLTTTVNNSSASGKTTSSAESHSTSTTTDNTEVGTTRTDSLTANSSADSKGTYSETTFDSTKVLNNKDTIDYHAKSTYATNEEGKRQSDTSSNADVSGVTGDLANFTILSATVTRSTTDKADFTSAASGYAANDNGVQTSLDQTQDTEQGEFTVSTSEKNSKFNSSSSFSENYTSTTSDENTSYSTRTGKGDYSSLDATLKQSGPDLWIDQHVTQSQRHEEGDISYGDTHWDHDYNRTKNTAPDSDKTTTTNEAEHQASNDKEGQYEEDESSKSFTLNDFHASETFASYSETGDAKFETSSWSETRTNPNGMTVEPPEEPDSAGASGGSGGGSSGGSGGESGTVAILVAEPSSTRFTTAFARTSSSGSGPYSQLVSDKTYDETGLEQETWHDEESSEQTSGENSSFSRQTDSRRSRTDTKTETTRQSQLETGDQSRDGTFTSSATFETHRHNQDTETHETSEFEEFGTTTVNTFSQYKNKTVTREFAAEDLVLPGKDTKIWSKDDLLYTHTAKEKNVSERHGNGDYSIESSYEYNAFNDDSTKLETESEESSESGTTSSTTETSAKADGKRPLLNPFFEEITSDASSGSTQNGNYHANSSYDSSTLTTVVDGLSTPSHSSLQTDHYDESGPTSHRNASNSTVKYSYFSDYTYDVTNTADTGRTGSGTYSELADSSSEQQDGEIHSFRSELSTAQGSATWHDNNSSTVKLDHHAEGASGTTKTETIINRHNGTDSFQTSHTEEQVDADASSKDTEHFETHANIFESETKTTSKTRALSPIDGDPDNRQGYNVIGNTYSSLQGTWSEVTDKLVEEWSTGKKHEVNTTTFDEDGTTTWNDIEQRTETREYQEKWWGDSTWHEDVTLTGVNGETDRGSGTYDRHTYTQITFDRSQEYGDSWTYAGDSHDKLTSQGTERSTDKRTETSEYDLPSDDGLGTTTLRQGTTTRSLDIFSETRFEASRNNYTHTLSDGQQQSWSDATGEKHVTNGRAHEMTRASKTITNRLSNSGDYHAVTTETDATTNRYTTYERTDSEYSRTTDKDGATSKDNHFLHWVGDSRSQTVAKSSKYVADEHGDDYASHYESLYTDSTTESSSLERAESLDQLTTTILNQFGMGPETDGGKSALENPFFGLQRRQSSKNETETWQWNATYSNSSGSGESSHVDGRSRTHSATELSHTITVPTGMTFPPLSYVAIPLPRHQRQISDVEIWVVAYQSSSTGPGYGDSYQWADAGIQSSVKDLKIAPGDNAGTQTDLSYSAGTSASSSYRVGGGGSYYESAWDSGRREVYALLVGGDVELTELTARRRDATHGTWSSTGRSGEGFSTSELIENFDGEVIQNVTHAHYWGSWTEWGESHSYDEWSHGAWEDPQYSRQTIFGWQEDTWWEVGVDLLNPFRVLWDRLGGFWYTVSWEYSNLGLNWTDPYEGPPQTTYTGVFDWVGQNVVLPWVGEERLLAGGRFGTGIMDDLMVAGLLATEIVGYVDPTPLSDTLNAGLNAADGNYADASMALGGALIPGGADKGVRAAGKAGNMMTGAFGAAAKNISKNTACDAPTAIGRKVGNLLSRCFVGETLVGIDEAWTSQLAGNWLVYSLAIGVASPALFVIATRGKKKKRPVDLTDEVFSTDAWQPEPLREGPLPLFHAADDSASFAALCDRLFHGNGEQLLDQPATIEPSSRKEVGQAMSRDSNLATLTAPTFRRYRHAPIATSQPAARTTSRIGILWAFVTLLLLSLCGFMAFRNVGQTHRRIDEVRIGDRATGHNPLRDEVEDVPEPTPENSRAVDLELTKPSGKKVEFTAIWTLDELATLRAAPGATVYVKMPEMGVEGNALILKIGPWKKKQGNGNLVIGTFKHEPENGLINVWVEGLADTIGCTPEHLFWSEDRLEFVPARELREREQVWTRQLGVVPVSRTASRPGTEPVYNLTIHGEHVYEITSAGILVHNQCSKFADLTKTQTIIYEVFEKSTGKAVYVGQVKGSKGTAARFTEHLSSASKQWSRNTHDIRAVKNGSWTPFEAHTYEMGRINALGGMQSLQNIRRPISEHKFNMYRNLHTDFVQDLY